MIEDSLCRRMMKKKGCPACCCWWLCALCTETLRVADPLTACGVWALWGHWLAGGCGISIDVVDVRLLKVLRAQ